MDSLQSKVGFPFEQILALKMSNRSYGSETARWVDCKDGMFMLP